MAPHRRGLPLLWRMVAVVLLLLLMVAVMLVVMEVVVVVADATLVILQLGLHEVMARGHIVLDGGVGVAHRGGAQLGDGVAVACHIQNNFRTKHGIKITTSTVQPVMRIPDVYPGSRIRIFPSRILICSIPDPPQRIKVF